MGLGADNLEPLAVVGVAGVVQRADRFDPALDAGQRRAQLMADRGDELVFHALGLGQVLGHLVDGMAQAADLVVVARVGQAGLQVAARNAVGDGFDLAQRPHDGADEE